MIFDTSIVSQGEANKKVNLQRPKFRIQPIINQSKVSSENYRFLISPPESANSCNSSIARNNYADIPIVNSPPPFVGRDTSIMGVFQIGDSKSAKGDADLLFKGHHLDNEATPWLSNFTNLNKFHRFTFAEEHTYGSGSHLDHWSGCQVLEQAFNKLKKLDIIT
jgi:hypothetical protein